MTSLIVYRASETPGDIWLASDLLHSRGDYLSDVLAPKWFRMGNWAFAVAGDYRVANVLSRSHPPGLPPSPETLPEFVYLHLSESGKELSPRDGSDSNGWPTLNSSILWAHPDYGAFSMDNIGGLLEVPPYAYEVAGSARDVLAGAVDAARYLRREPREAMDLALRIAERRHAYSHGVFVQHLEGFLRNEQA